MFQQMAVIHIDPGIVMKTAYYPYRFTGHNQYGVFAPLFMELRGAAVSGENLELDIMQIHGMPFHLHPGS